MLFCFLFLLIVTKMSNVRHGRLDLPFADLVSLLGVFILTECPVDGRWTDIVGDGVLYACVNNKTTKDVDGLRPYCQHD
jgi:hypothetical protein